MGDPPEIVDADGLLDRCRRDGLVLPDYGGQCFARIPGTAASVLGVDVGPTLPAGVLDGAPVDRGATSDAAISHVVVVLVDGLGWRRFQRDGDEHRFLRRLRNRATVTPLTSVLPSSTAAAITTIHTAATPAEHGVLGWDVRLPDHDAIVETFLHERRDAPDGAADEADDPPISADEVVQTDPIYPTLEAAGVETRVVQPAGTLGTAYANARFRGATQIPYDGIADGARTLRAELADASEPSYTYFYAPDVDAASHAGGADSIEYRDALATVCRELDEALYDDLDAATAEETLLLVTADHGFTDFEPGPAGCLDPTEIPAVEGALERRPDGEPVPPWGDYRASHLAVRDGHRDRVRDALEARGATVLDRETVVDWNLYGTDTQPNGAFEQRCGDLVSTHPEKKLVHPGAETIVPKIGMHGGPTREELLVPFAAARLADLRGGHG